MSTESAVKHTPGPWRVRDTPESSNQDFMVESMNGGRTNAIASIDYQNHDGEAEANARLIAAAPALLEALENAQIFIDYLCEISTLKNKSVRMLGGYQNIEAIIRKAKGE